MNDKPKIIKGLKITHGNNVYSKVYNLSIYGDSVYFSNAENDTTTVNIDCSIKDVIIEFGDSNV